MLMPVKSFSDDERVRISNLECGGKHEQDHSALSQNANDISNFKLQTAFASKVGQAATEPLAVASGIITQSTLVEVAVYSQIK
jgi:hypothetical protein